MVKVAHQLLGMFGVRQWWQQNAATLTLLQRGKTNTWISCSMLDVNQGKYIHSTNLNLRTVYPNVNQTYIKIYLLCFLSSGPFSMMTRAKPNHPDSIQKMFTHFLWVLSEDKGNTTRTGLIGLPLLVLTNLMLTLPCILNHLTDNCIY